MKKTLSFLNLLDQQGNLSITNLAVIITLVKLAISPTASITEAGTLLIALANYAHKRVVSNQKEDESPLQATIDETRAKISEMQTNINGLLIKSGMKL